MDAGGAQRRGCKLLPVKVTRFTSEDMVAGEEVINKQNATRTLISVRCRPINRDVQIMLLGVAIYALKTFQLCSNYATNFAILCFGYALNTAKLCFLMRGYFFFKMLLK